MRTTSKTPKEYKQLIGTYRKDRDKSQVQNTELPDSLEEIPLPPKKFSLEQIDLWNNCCQYLIEHGQLKKIYLFYIEAYCESYKMYLKAAELVRNEGSTIESNGRYGKAIKRHPALVAMNIFTKQMLDISDRFGFSPSSKMKIKGFVKTEDPKDDPFSKF